MSLLINKYYKKYKKEGLLVPDEITKYTREYQKECDKYIEFITDSFEFTKDINDKIHLTEVHEQYKLWHDDNHNDNKYISKAELRKYLVKKFTKKFVKSQYLYGCKLKVKTNPTYDISNNIQESNSLISSF